MPLALNFVEGRSGRRSSGVLQSSLLFEVTLSQRGHINKITVELCYTLSVNLSDRNADRVYAFLFSQSTSLRVLSSLTWRRVSTALKT